MLRCSCESNSPQFETNTLHSSVLLLFRNLEEDITQQWCMNWIFTLYCTVQSSFLHSLIFYFFVVKTSNCVKNKIYFYFDYFLS